MKLARIDLKNTGLELSKGEKSMSNRHYLRLENKYTKSIISECQILGNNDYFDEEFYKNLNINVDEDGVIEPVKINYIDFLYEWDRWLNKYPEKKGLPEMPEYVRKNKNIKILKWNVFMHYSIRQSYEQQLYEVTRGLYPKYIDCRGNIKDRYEMILECY